MVQTPSLFGFGSACLQKEYIWSAPSCHVITSLLEVSLYGKETSGACTPYLGASLS